LPAGRLEATATQDAILDHIDDDNKVPEARVTITNFGQTPAYELIHLGGLALSKYPVPPHVIMTIRDDDFAASAHNKTDLGPGHHHIAITSTSLGRSFTVEERSSLATGEYAIHVFGEVRYRDAFGNRRYTKYRYITGGPASVRGGQLASYGEGNKAT
jgi:hypothetical protein